MSSTVARIFTAASIISLGGLTATASIIACSSDGAAAPAGDDDDDTKGDDDDTKTSKEAGASSSSSSSSSSSGGATCDFSKFVGTWELAKPTYQVTSPGKVCDNFAKGGNDNAVPTEVVITKGNGEEYQAESGGSTLLLLPADNKCEIGGGINPIGQETVDADNNPIVAKLTPTQFYDLDGDTITSKVNYKVESDPPGAKGTPCDMSQIATGTRKK